MDNLDRALQASKQSGANDPMVQGVSMVLAQVLDVFKRHGIQRIQAEGTLFNPNLHQAVMQVPSKDLPVSTVVQVLENGYTLHDRVIRPASVSVSSQAD
jgi:molecular chaperone GrpE